MALLGRTPLPTLRSVAALLRPRRRTPVQLTCYGKADCSLCDRAKAPVARLVNRSRGSLHAVWIDIASDAELLTRWGERIPVICAGEVVLAEGKVSEVRLRRALETYLRGGDDA